MHSESQTPSLRQEKGTQTQLFLVWISSGGAGVFRVKGWGPKSSVCPLKTRETKFFGGISWDFAGISRKCPKSLRKKRLCSIFVPQSRVLQGQECIVESHTAICAGKSQALVFAGKVMHCEPSFARKVMHRAKPQFLLGK